VAIVKLRLLNNLTYLLTFIKVKNIAHNAASGAASFCDFGTVYTFSKFLTFLSLVYTNAADATQRTQNY